MNSNNSSLTKVLLSVGGVILCCVCIAVVGAGIFLYRGAQSLPQGFATQFLPPAANTPMPIPTLNRLPPEAVSSETIDILNSNTVPENDPYNLACALKKICNVSKTVPDKTYAVGDKEKFWISDTDTAATNQITATLRYITPHSYFWSQDGVNINQQDMKALMDTFETKIYPTDREFFGSEPTPGVDNDPHVFVVFSRGTGASNAGYFSSPDEYNPQVYKYSNGHEMFVFNADNLDLSSEETYSVLAHEFQHMIHFNTDRNETSWMNEGFSVVAELLNGYSIGFDHDYIADPDLNLTDWSSDPGTNGPHYGEAFLYLDYFLDRFGKEATQAVVKSPANGLESIDQVLAAQGIQDSNTGKPLTADDVFMDWAATLYLQDSSVGDGRYAYHNYPDAPKASATETIDSCPQSTLDRTVNQYGIDYINITCSGDYTLHFSGSTVAKLFPEDAHSGKYVFWSNKGDESDMTLTHDFDFTNVSGPINFSYWTWYDLEKDYDYLYLEASTDGQDWEIIKTPSSTDSNPAGNSYGWGYTGASDNWIQEQVDLSKYAGKKVQLRFEYITDPAVNGQGLLLDDVQLDALNYKSDFEADDGGWMAKGFVRVENSLPQTYRLSLITQGSTTTVTPVALNADNTADIPLTLNSGETATLIVSGMTRYTTQATAYQVEIK